MNSDDMFENAEIISRYTSEQAADDGYLVAVDKHGEPRINFFTRSVCEKCLLPYAKKSSDFPDLVRNLKCTVICGIIRAGKKIQLQPDFKFLDTFYEVKINGWKFWLCQNETGSYTLLFPEDY